MAVDRVGAWDSYLVEFSMLQEISEQHKSAWAQAYSVVPGKWKEATTLEETNRALRQGLKKNSKKLVEFSTKRGGVSDGSIFH